MSSFFTFFLGRGKTPKNPLGETIANELKENHFFVLPDLKLILKHWHKNGYANYSESFCFKESSVRPKNPFGLLL